MSTYDLRPCQHPSGVSAALSGWEAIASRLSDAIVSCGKDRTVLAIECYPGVSAAELDEGLFSRLPVATLIHSDDYASSAEEIQARITDCITDDRVFGVLSHYRVEQFFDEVKRREVASLIDGASGLVIVYGVGASVIADPDILVYADLTRWEIQGRFRHEHLTNWKTDNAGEDVLRKYKRGYFFEWRMADRLKCDVLGDIDFLLDTNRHDDPSMIDGTSFRSALSQVVQGPFRLVPYFDASVWGGHWMQERFGLDPSAKNYGWAFDGVPEENSLLFDFGGTEVEVPALDVVFSHPVELLGPQVYARFGPEFPIRFDYLDTMGGANLSLQVHPLTGYIQDRFGMSYTQDESYYILDATEGSKVYLGVRTGVDKDELIDDLRCAERGEAPFDDERYVNSFPVRKHDHVHIPAGTIHCGGSGTVILEISATPYIFTFKLWDWGRLGLDGLPRPVHIDHGAANIVMSRDTAFCRDHLIDRVDDPHDDLSTEKDVTVERTGLDELEFIETRRSWFVDSATYQTRGSVNMLNLVEGDTAMVESLDGAFDPFPIAYGETFIVPERVGSYRIVNTGDRAKRIAVIQAFVKDLS